jgi:hypothetical protein
MEWYDYEEEDDESGENEDKEEEEENSEDNEHESEESEEEGEQEGVTYIYFIHYYSVQNSGSHQDHMGFQFQFLSFCSYSAKVHVFSHFLQISKIFLAVV